MPCLAPCGTFDLFKRYTGHRIEVPVDEIHSLASHWRIGVLPVPGAVPGEPAAALAWRLPSPQPGPGTSRGWIATGASAAKAGRDLEKKGKSEHRVGEKLVAKSEQVCYKQVTQQTDFERSNQSINQSN